jgi:hypothetical protein
VSDRLLTGIVVAGSALWLAGSCATTPEPGPPRCELPEGPGLAALPPDHPDAARCLSAEDYLDLVLYLRALRETVEDCR